MAPKEKTKNSVVIDLETQDSAVAERNADAGRFVKHFFYLLLSAFLTVGAIFFEAELLIVREEAMNVELELFVDGNNRVELVREGAEIPEKFTKDILLEMGDTFKTNTSSNVSVRFPSDAIMRLDEDTEMRLLTLNRDDDIYEFELIKGQVWMNTLYDGTDVRLISEGVVIAPKQSVINVHRIGGQIDVHVLHHQSQISFYYEDEFLNDFYVAEGNKILVRLEKLTPVLGKLYYSKLIKEFRYSLFNSALVDEDSWFKENSRKDDQYRAVLVQRESDQLRQKGISNSSIDSVTYQFENAFNFSVRTALTFAEDKEQEIYLNTLFAHVDDAMYLAESGEFDEALRRLEFFDIQKSQLSFTALDKDQYREALEARIDQLLYASPGDHLYLVKENLLRKRLAVGSLDAETDFVYLQYYLNDVYHAAHDDFDNARSVLRAYFKTTDDFLNVQVSQADAYFKNLQVQNHFLDNLLLRYPTFYSKEFFKKKGEFEDSFLVALPAGAVEKEERRSLINKKIVLLKRLQYFFFEEKVALDDARAVVRLLVADVQDLLPANTSDVAIQEFFKQSVGDFTLFLGYLNNNEFSDSVSHGNSHEIRYQAYLDARDSDLNVISVRDNFFNYDNTELHSAPETREDIIRQVKKEFGEVSVGKLQFSDELVDEDRYVTLEQGEVGRYKFRGVYDRESKVISDVYVGGNLISKSGVRLKNLQTLIESKFSNLQGSQSTDPDFSDAGEQISAQDKLLRLLFIRKMAEFDMNLNFENVQIISSDLGIFRVTGLEVPGSPEALYTFDVISDKEIANNIEIVTLRHQVKLNEDVDLAELSVQVKLSYSQYLKEVEALDAGDEIVPPVSVPVPRR